MTMKLALQKLEKIDGEVTLTRIDVARIQGHLKQLNGTVATQQKRLDAHSSDIKKIRGEQIKLATLVGVLVSGLTFMVNKIF